MSAPPVQAIGAAQASDPLLLGVRPLETRSPASTSFSQTLLNGIDQVNHKLIDADAMAKAFTLDDSIPLHQVTFALEQARLSFELMLQVRSKLIDSYQEFSRMQL